MKNIVEVVQNIERAVSGRWPGCVFRGEPACFDKVSSGLYRTYGLEKGEGEFSIETVESEMVEKARSFTEGRTTSTSCARSSTGAHRGGKTNRIDFTRDLGVALFFACGTAAGVEREPGRVIMLNDSEAVRKAGVAIRGITHPIRMAAAQKSVFVSTDSGYLDDRHAETVRISSRRRRELRRAAGWLKLHVILPNPQPLNRRQTADNLVPRAVMATKNGFIRRLHVDTRE